MGHRHHRQQEGEGRVLALCPQSPVPRQGHPAAHGFVTAVVMGPPDGHLSATSHECSSVPSPAPSPCFVLPLAFACLCAFLSPGHVLLSVEGLTWQSRDPPVMRPCHHFAACMVSARARQTATYPEAAGKHFDQGSAEEVCVPLHQQEKEELFLSRLLCERRQCPSCHIRGIITLTTNLTTQ